MVSGDSFGCYEILQGILETHPNMDIHEWTGIGRLLSASVGSSVARWNPDLEHALNSVFSIFADIAIMLSWANCNILPSHHARVP